MRVVATRTAYQDLRRYKEGAEFEIKSPDQFSAACMKPVGSVPKEFAEVVERKVKEFEGRKSPEQLRREALEARTKASSADQAQIIAQAVAGVVGPVVAQALAIQREEHAKLIASASGKKL